MLPTEITFIVSANDKGDNPKRPDWRGEVRMGGQTFKLAAWRRRKGGNGPEFISGKLTLEPAKPISEPDPANGQAPRGEERPVRAPIPPNVDEDVPF